MNTPLAANPTHRMAAILAGTRATVSDVGPAAWTLRSAPPASDVTARWDGEWLELAAGPLTSAAALAHRFMPETLLRWNGTLPGNARFGIDAGRQLTLRAEVPWVEDVDPGPRLIEAWTGVEAGLGLLEGRPSPDAIVPAAPVVGSLKPVAEAAGWPFHERQDGRLDFSLDDNDAALQAKAQARSDGSARVWTTLAALSGLGEAPRRALAVLLLRAGAALRLARPILRGEGGTESADLEVIIAPAPPPRELALALESLAVGAALAAAEAKLLCHEQMAKEFLTVGKLDSAGDQRQQPTTKGNAW